MRSRVSRGRGAAPSSASMYRPMAGVTGARRVCRNRCSPRRSRAFASTGRGTARRHCCNRAPSTKPGSCSRRSGSCARCAARVRSITTTRSRPGASMRAARCRMSRCSSLARTLVMIALVVATSALGAPDATKHYGFGKPASAEEIAGWDIDVRPDGTGLPAGRGTVAQGQEIYDAKCASCHGTFGESTDYLPLAGGVGTLASSQPMRTTGSKLNYATTLFDYIRRAMPFTNPKSLTDDEVYALTAYVLNLNDIVPAGTTLDRASLVALKMPNRDGFTRRHGMGS